MLRVISSVVLAPLALGVAYVGEPLFVAFWAVAALAVLWEWTTLTAPSGRTVVFAAGAITISGAAILLMLHRPGAAVLLAAVGVVVGALLGRGGSRLWSACGVAYAGAAIAPALLRADTEWGFSAIMLVFAAVWLTDVAAYFCGRAIGGPKLMPRISPNKTWSGAIGGTVAAVCGGAAVAAIAGSAAVGPVAAVTLLLSIASQVGDLGESALKRRFGAKDSGQLIPGHGGVMDRLDGFIVAALAAALIGVARAGLDRAATGLMVW